jgi:hypothetical protein
LSLHFSKFFSKSQIAKWSNKAKVRDAAGCIAIECPGFFGAFGGADEIIWCWLVLSGALPKTIDNTTYMLYNLASKIVVLLSKKEQTDERISL